MVQHSTKYYKEYYYQGQRTTQTIAVHIRTLPIICQMLQFIEQWSITSIFFYPLTGIHKQEFESAWGQLKYYIKREKGIRALDQQILLKKETWSQ